MDGYEREEVAMATDDHGGKFCGKKVMKAETSASLPTAEIVY